MSLLSKKMTFKRKKICGKITMKYIPNHISNKIFRKEEKNMGKNKKFLGKAIIFCILGIVFMFLYSGLMNDQINIIQTYSAWTPEQTQLPMTVGNFVCIFLTFLFGTFFIKWGVKKPMIVTMIITAIGTAGVALANGLTVNGGEGNYVLYFISLFIVRCGCMMFQMAGFQLAATWFIKYRGRILGIITLGSPLFSVVGTAGMTKMIDKYMGKDYRLFYYGIAALIIVVVVLVALLIKDTPEECGLYPDGADHAPISEGEVEEVKVTLKDVLTTKKGWQLIISFGALTFIINACMASMAVRYMSLGAGPNGEPVVWFAALKWLAVGAILGIPMSYVFGILDDKIGTVKASIVLAICELLPVLGLMLQPQGGSEPLMIMWGFGVACMTGGVPTLHPSIMAYAYGRREYQSANRIIMAIQLIPCAFAAQMMIKFIMTGRAVLGYGILIGIIAIGIITLITMLKMPDAQAADRGYNKK